MYDDSSLFIEVIKDNLNKGREVQFIAKGNSMLPLIRPMKDTIYLEPINKEQIRVGDIVLFHFEGKAVLHRVAFIRGEVIILRGDGNTRRYEYCHYTNIIARVKNIKRGKISIHRNSLLSKLYGYLWPKRNILRSFLLNLYKYFNKNYA